MLNQTVTGVGGIRMPWGGPYQAVRRSDIAAPTDLTIRGLRIAFGRPGSPHQVTAACADALDVPAGARLAIAGPSGSGKTTLLHAMAGLLSPAAGTIRWGDTDFSGMGETARDHWRRTHLGIVFQDFHLVPELSARDNVLLPLWFGLARVRPEQVARAGALLAGVGIATPNRRAALLSRGEQQRVAIALAVLSHPAAILADEPTASLDAASGEAVTGLLLQSAAAAGATLIVVTHDPAVLARFPVVRTMDKGMLAA